MLDTDIQSVAALKQEHTTLTRGCRRCSLSRACPTPLSASLLLTAAHGRIRARPALSMLRPAP